MFNVVSSNNKGLITPTVLIYRHEYAVYNYQISFRRGYFYKLGDFRIAYDTMQRIETRLEHAFLLNASVQRQAERVTAEEIRFMAEALEQSLGGIYDELKDKDGFLYMTYCNENVFG